jgi:hypothetical protein
VFRETILARLLDRHAISSQLVQKLLGWRHPGFSAHVGESIPPQDRQRLEDTAAYLVRNPLSLRKLVYLDGQQAVLYRSRMNPSLGRNFEALDPLEWLARMSDHIPDPGQHRTSAGRVRAAGGLRRATPPTLFAHLGTPHREDLPGGSARLHSLRPEDADDRLPENDREFDPRSPRAARAAGSCDQPAGTPTRTKRPREGKHARGGVSVSREALRSRPPR